MIVRGVESVDILSMEGGLEVPSQHFWELYDYDSSPDSLYRRFESTLRSDGYEEAARRESIFGLAVDNPQKQSETLEYPNKQRNAHHSPFQMMIEEEVLEKNIFSLKLPRHYQDEGHLMLGGYDDTAFEGDLTPHPIFPSHTKSWSIEASSISITATDASGSSQLLFNESLAGYQAILSTSSSHITIPDPLYSRILAPLNLTSGVGEEYVVDCDNIDKLPVITIAVGDRKISLAGRDYIQRIPVWHSRWDIVQCVPIFHRWYIPTPKPEHYIPPSADEANCLTLGTAFLQKVYSVFDHDKRTISCTCTLIIIQLASNATFKPLTESIVGVPRT